MDFKQNTVGSLKRVKARLENEESWCKGAYALDEDNQLVSPVSSRACKWCLFGAAEVEFHFLGVSLNHILSKAARVRKFKSIVQLNDDLNHAGVLQFLDEVIKEEEGQ